MTYTVALEALAGDATIWDETSTTLADASTEASGLTLTDDDLSFAGTESGVTSTYTQLQNRLVTLLADGGTQTGHVGDTLRYIKREYENNEAQAESRYRGQWAVK